MAKPLFSPVAGLIQDVLLLSAVFLLVAGFCMFLSLRVWDGVKAKRRKKASRGRLRAPLLE